MIENGVVRVVVRSSDGEGTGTGFIVNDDSVIVTNHHVVDGGSRFSVILSGSSNEIPATLIKLFPDLDLAFLKTEPLNRPQLKLSSAEIKKGDDVLVLGFPGLADRLGRAKDTSLSDGTISRVFYAPWERGGRAIGLIQHTSAINPGNSGGPLFDDCGRVIGVNTQGSGSGRIIRDREGRVIDVMGGGGVYFASRIVEAIRELKQLGIQLQEINSPCISDNGTEQARIAQSEARQAGARASEAEQTARTAQERADAADSAAGEASQRADEASEEAKRATEDTHKAKEELKLFSKQVITWITVLGIVTLITLALALRKPRQQIIRIVERYSHKISQLVSGTRKKGRAMPKEGLALIGFDRNGQALRVQISPSQLVCGYGFCLGRHPNLVERFIEDDDVSKRHCRFSWGNNAYHIEDLSSSYGTFINNQQLRPFQKLELHPGDVIRLGSTELSVHKGA